MNSVNPVLRTLKKNLPTDRATDKDSGAKALGPLFLERLTPHYGFRFGFPEKILR